MGLLAIYSNFSDPCLLSRKMATRLNDMQEHHGIAAFYPEKWPRVSMICKSIMALPPFTQKNGHASQ
eukprot:scaffold18851_cov147-Skeletonema_marinoi.AAC.1